MLMLLSVHVTSILFSVLFNNFSGGDIGPECLQSDDSYSLDAFGDIDALIVDLPDFAGTPPRLTEC